MRKITFIFVLVLSLASAAKAQNWFVNGGLGVGYAFETFTSVLKAGGGYEINDKWAVASDASFGVTSDYSYIQIDSYLRYNVWNKDSFYLDGKAGYIFEVLDGDCTNVPYIGAGARYRYNEKWELSLDLAKIGVVFGDWDTDFYGKFITMTPEIGVTYRF